MDFSDFDNRKYPTVSVPQGYGEWARTYEDTVPDELDIPLLSRIRSVNWTNVRRAVDLACGTGRTGAWLALQGVKRIDGIDLTPKMLELARHKGVYEHLQVGDALATPLASAAYDLCIMVLADEHLEDLEPLYREAARLTAAAGRFVIVGYHPHFMLKGIPPHFDRDSGEPVAIESYVHLTSDHVKSAHAAGWSLWEMEEHLINSKWLAKKPKWEKFLNHPISFSMVWAKASGAATAPLRQGNRG